MSYYTTFELDVFQGTADLRIVLKRLNEIILSSSNPTGERIEYFEIDETDGLIRSAFPLPWYEHDENVSRLSLSFPGVVFRLHGEGEGTDLWESYYKDGLCQICRAQLLFPPFDPTKLKSVEDAQIEDFNESMVR